MHMHGTIKKKLQLYTYIDSNYILSYFFLILISLRYTHEFTLSFYYYFFVYWAFDDLFILDLSSFAPH